MIAERLSEEEIAGLKEMFKMIDVDNSGSITFDELKDGLRKLGSALMDTEIRALMEAVRPYLQSISSLFLILLRTLNIPQLTL